MSKSAHVEIYRTQVGGYWRWRFRAANGRILSQSSESYEHPRDLVRGLELSHPGYRMLDVDSALTGRGGWYLWPYTSLFGYDLIRVRVPEGTVKLWRARRKR